MFIETAKVFRLDIIALNDHVLEDNITYLEFSALKKINIE